MANKGYILLHRKIQDHWIWTSNDRFDDRSAWIDLLLMVNHEEKKVPFYKSFVTVKRGQKMTSQVKLAARWHWSRERVKRFLKRLENDGMIITDTARGNTLVTIVNYDNFQDGRTPNESGNKSAYVTTHKAGCESATESQTNNDINNDSNNESKNEEKRRTPAPPRDGGEWQ